MGTLQEELSAPKTGSTQRQRQTTTPAPSAKRSGMDVVKALRETRTRQQTAKDTATATKAAMAQQEETAEMVAELLYADEVLTAELSQLNRQKGRHPRGSVQANEVANLVDQQTENQALVRQDLASLKASNPSAYTEGTRRYNFRQEALEMAESNRQLIGSVTAADIKSRRDSAIESEFIVATTNRDEATFSFDRQGYVSAWPHDASVSDVAASLKELVDNLRERNDDRDQAVVAELVRGGFYISARRDPDGKGGQLPSELDLLRDEPGTVRKASEFLAGNGQRYVAKVGWGFVVIENRNGKFVAVKTSNVKVGRALFTVPDRQSQSGARVARKSQPEIANDGSITATDLAGVWYDPLRMALEEDLRREAESAERREAADELRDLSDIPDLITTYNLSQKQAGTSVVNARVGNREAGEHETLITMRLTGDGSGMFIVSQHVPGTIDKVDPEKRWLARAFNKDGQPVPMSVEVFKRVDGWRELLKANAWHDRNWQLARKAKELGATVITSDNVADLTGTEDRNGTYAFAVNDKRDNKRDPRRRPTDPIKEWFVPLGFIVKREGQTLHPPVYAVPGPSANKLEKMGDAQSIISLAPVFRAILRNLLFAAAPRENGQRVRVEVPEHLKPVKRQDAATNTEK